MSLWRLSAKGNRSYETALRGANQALASFSKAADPSDFPDRRGRGRGTELSERLVAPGSQLRPSDQQPQSGPLAARQAASGPEAPSNSPRPRLQGRYPARQPASQQQQQQRRRLQGDRSPAGRQQLSSPRPPVGRQHWQPGSERDPPRPVQRPDRSVQSSAQQQQQQQSWQQPDSRPVPHQRQHRQPHVHDGLPRAPRQQAGGQQPQPDQQESADFADADAQVQPEGKGQPPVEIQLPGKAVTAQATGSPRRSRPQQRTAGRGKLFAEDALPPGQAAKATEDRAAGRGQAFGQLPPPAVARGPAGLPPGARQGMNKEQLWEMTTQEVQAQTGRKMRLPHKPGFRVQQDRDAPTTVGVGQNSRYPTFARGQPRAQEAEAHEMLEDEYDTGFFGHPPDIEMGPVPDTRDSRVRPLGHEEPQEVDPPSAQDLPPGGKLRLFDEQDNNKRIRHLSKLPDFEERGLDEHDLVETAVGMQRLADPRLNFDFGAPRMEDAIPEPHPAAQILEHKQELMATVGLTEEEFEEAGAHALREYAQLQATYTIIKPEWEAMKLMEMVTEGLPQENPLYRHVQQSVCMVRDNPGWGWPEKVRFTHKLISQSKRIERRLSN